MAVALGAKPNDPNEQRGSDTNCKDRWTKRGGELGLFQTSKTKFSNLNLCNTSKAQFTNKLTKQTTQAKKDTTRYETKQGRAKL